jgi:hypothetical protein
MTKKVYKENIKDATETRTVKTEKGDVKITYEHTPNVVGKRSKYTGLPIWIGTTKASGSLNGGTQVETEAKCWLKEPFTYQRGRVVTTGRLLKELGLPTSLAEQVKD